MLVVFQLIRDLSISCCTNTKKKFDCGICSDFNCFLLQTQESRQYRRILCSRAVLLSSKWKYGTCLTPQKSTQFTLKRPCSKDSSNQQEKSLKETQHVRFVKILSKNPLNTEKAMIRFTAKDIVVLGFIVDAQACPQLTLTYLTS